MSFSAGRHPVGKWSTRAYVRTYLHVQAMIRMYAAASGGESAYASNHVVRFVRIPKARNNFNFEMGRKATGTGLEIILVSSLFH